MNTSISIDAVSDSGRKLSDILIDDSNDYDIVDIVADSKVLLELIDKMPNRDVVILHRRFGIEGKTWTLQEIGDELGMSRERVRQIESDAIDYLRRALIRRKNMKSIRFQKE